MILLCCASELGLPEDLSAIEVILYYYYYYYEHQWFSHGGIIAVLTFVVSTVTSLSALILWYKVISDLRWIQTKIC